MSIYVNNNGLEYRTTPSTAYADISFFAWVKIDTNDQYNYVFANGVNGGYGHGYMLGVKSNASGNIVYLDISYVASLNSSLSITDNNWHLIGFYRSSSDYHWHIYLDGSDEDVGSNGANGIDSGDLMTVGGWNNEGTPYYECSATIAHAGFWERVLTSGERSQLLGGDSPLSISTSNLIVYLPFVSGDLGNNDGGSGGDFSASGTVTYSSDEPWSSGTTVNDSRSAKLTGEATGIDIELRDNGSGSFDIALTTVSSSSANDERYAKLSGSDITNSSRSAKTHGSSDVNSSRSAKVTGINTGNSERSAKLTGQKLPFDYVFADFEKKATKWARTSGGGTMAITDIGGAYDHVMRFQTPAGGDVEIHRDFSYGTNMFKGFKTLDMDIDLHGATIIGGDASAFGFDQSGWKYVSLSSYVTQGYDGMQHISIPIADFVSAGLNVDAISTFAVVRFWHSEVITVDIDNITFKDHQFGSFGQPSLPSVIGTHTWPIQAVDTMKWSKDTMRGQKTQTQIDDLIAVDSGLGLTHIAVDCPYDAYDSYSPVITDGYKAKFLTAVRNAGLKVWHRQHFNEWEGDYDFTKTTPRTTPSRALGTPENVLNGTDTTSWLALHYHYILDHSSEFEAGDIFTPIAEIENGGVDGGTNDQFSNYRELWEFMRDLQTVCTEAFKSIGLEHEVFVGFWGNSGYTLANRFDEFTADCIGYLSADHYIFDDAQMSSDLDGFWSNFQVPIVIGEWGNYVSSDPTATVLREIFDVFVAKGGQLVGVNYWNDIGGSYESLMDSSYVPNENWYALREYYSGIFVVDSERDAKLTGSSTSNSERSAKITGVSGATSERNAKIHGTDTSQSERDAKTTGMDSAQGERSAKILGTDTAQSERDAKITGTSKQVSLRSAKLSGIDTSSSVRDAKLTGQQTGNSERYAKIAGIATSNSERSAVITGELTSNSERDAKVIGKNVSNSERSAKLTGIPIYTDSERDAKLSGVDTDSSERPSKLVGKDSAESERSSKLIGDIRLTSERDSKVLGKDSGNSVRSAKTHGSILTADEVLATMLGKDTSGDSRNAKVIGSLSSNDERDAKLSGIQTLSSERSAKISVEGGTGSNRSAKIHGKDSTQSERASKVTGGLQTYATRSAKLQGIVSVISEIYAKLSGTSLNGSERNATIVGKDTDASERDAKLFGVSLPVSSRFAKLTGKDSSSDSRSAKIEGKLGGSSERSAKLFGATRSSDERSAKVIGVETTFSTRNASIIGSLNAFSEVFGKIFGKNTSITTRNAKIVGKSTTGSQRNATLFGGLFENDERYAKILGKKKLFKEPKRFILSSVREYLHRGDVSHNQSRTNEVTKRMKLRK